MGTPQDCRFLVQKIAKFKYDMLGNPLPYYHIRTPFPLSQGFSISVNAHYPPSNSEPVNIIKLNDWSYNSINFHISKFNCDEPGSSDSDDEDNVEANNINLELHIFLFFF